MNRLRRSIADVRSLAALPRIQFALLVHLKGVQKMATLLAGIIYLVVNISAMSVSITTIEATKTVMRHFLLGKKYGPVMEKVNPV